MAEQKNSTAWVKTRKFFNDIHLWAGLISGIVVLVVCLTGTLYVYNTEIREWNVSHLYRVDRGEGEKALPVDVLLEESRKTVKGRITGLKISADPSRSLQVNAKEEGDKSRSGTTYFFNPYTGGLLGNSKEENSAATFMGYIFSLHRWLLLDKIEEPIFGDLENKQLGKYITGSATILFTLGVLTGLVIWIPRKVKNWRQGLKIKFSSNWKRINHDLHNSLAFYAAIILFLMGATGPYFSFTWYREALKKSLGTYQEAGVKDKKSGNNNVKSTENTEMDNVGMLSLEDYLTSVDQTLDYNGDYAISLPQDGAATMSISKNRVGFFAPAAADKLVLDVATGEVIKADIFREKSLNERISASIKALHMGYVYGSFSKLLYFISCLIATSLPITGTLIWINKMKKTKKRQQKKAMVI
jgi:uncharacterized iron-regulated membrane protein